jgi:hypothetical protein
MNPNGFGRHVCSCANLCKKRRRERAVLFNCARGPLLKSTCSHVRLLFPIVWGSGGRKGPWRHLEAGEFARVQPISGIPRPRQILRTRTFGISLCRGTASTAVRRVHPQRVRAALTLQNAPVQTPMHDGANTPAPASPLVVSPMPTTVIPSHVNEEATSGGVARAETRTEAFMRNARSFLEVVLPPSDMTLTFDGSGRCVGCAK